MKLFFETDMQLRFFLLMFPVGFLIGWLLDCRTNSTFFQAIIDLFVLFVCGVALIFFLMASGDRALRIYHLLGIVCGMILYLGGIGRVRACARKRIGRFQAGKMSGTSEINERNQCERKG